MKRSKLVIFDACTIIDAHKLSIWKSLTSQYDVHVSSIVARSEVRFFVGTDGSRHDIDLTADLTAGRITELEATVEELASLSDHVKDVFVLSLDMGEREIVALLKSGRYEEHALCTGDMLAIKALAHFQISTRGVSLERLSTDAKIKCGKIPGKYSETAFKQQIAKGMMEAEMAKKAPK